MSLAAEGSLGLDTSVRSVIGDELELIDAAVTVGHLLAHTSGIGDYMDEAAIDDIDDYDVPEPVRQLAARPTTSPCCAVIRRSSRRVSDSSTATADSWSWRSSRKS